MDEAVSAEAGPKVAAPPPRSDPVALPGREVAERIHQDQYPALVRFLLLQGASWTEAQDAAQEAFTQMCVPDLAVIHPKAWLRTVAWRSWVRQQVRHEDTCADPPEEQGLNWQTPEHAAEIDESQRRVIQLLLRLPAKQRAAIAWTMDGFTAEESARAMGTTPAAVRQNLARARAALKSELGLSGARPGPTEGER
ncbi:RNA polymerase sigma factor [Streptomyces sp. NPDC057638]|uniref:RNA polymerase sigma factor n=1 Tax=Streptomyces sp. NPDC057638 TaxID=3346190 RepID=UPI0036C88395